MPAPRAFFLVSSPEQERRALTGWTAAWWLVVGSLVASCLALLWAIVTWSPAGIAGGLIGLPIMYFTVYRWLLAGLDRRRQLLLARKSSAASTTE